MGSLTAKAVVMENKTILGSKIIPARADVVQSASEVMDKLLEDCGLSHEDIDYCISTGYGRDKIPFADGNISEISCHGKGAYWIDPNIRTIIDIGGQDYKVIRVKENGALDNFLMNTKCAAGTGRSLEIMAKSLGVDVSQLGPLSLKSDNPIEIINICSAFTEFEIRLHLLKGEDRADIAAGIIKLTANRVAATVRRLGPKNDMIVTGGVSKNVGMNKYLEKALKTKFVEFTEDPQIVGALGAALFAADKVKKIAKTHI